MRPKQTTDKMPVTNIDIAYLQKVYAAALKGKDEVITDFIHPNGMLPFDDGRKCVTEINVFEKDGQYIQYLKPGMRERIIKEYELIEKNILKKFEK